MSKERRPSNTTELRRQKVSLKCDIKSVTKFMKSKLQPRSTFHTNIWKPPLGYQMSKLVLLFAIVISIFSNY